MSVVLNSDPSSEVGAKVNPLSNKDGVGSNRGGRKVTEMAINYYLTEDKGSAPSVKLRQRSELTRQKTSENRLYELHLSAYPNAVCEETVPSPRTADKEKMKQILSSASNSNYFSPRVKIPYPTLCSTNQLFNNVVMESKERLKDISPERSGVENQALVYASTYDKDWTPQQKSDVKAARKLPYDSTISSVVGTLKTIYRDDFCRKAKADDFRDQVMGAEQQQELTLDHGAQPSTSTAAPRPSTGAAGRNAFSIPAVPALRTITVGDPTSSAPSSAPSEYSLWTDEGKCVSPRCTSARSPRIAAASSSPRRSLEVFPSPRRHYATSSEQFITLPQSYFTNRAKYTVK